MQLQHQGLRLQGGIGSTFTVLEHERVQFPSYPHEWPAEALHAAGRLTLDLAEASLLEGFGLKDATPSNVLFRGPSPVFVDVLSFERRIAGDVVWRAYAQFVRTFLLPLLAHRRFGLRLADIFTNRRDGLEPEDLLPLSGTIRRFLPPVLTLITLPAWLGRKTRTAATQLSPARTLLDHEKARFILQSLFSRLRRTLNSLAPRTEPCSTWAGYMDSHSYTADEFRQKEEFVQSALDELKPSNVLDVGANTGHFSRLAAEEGGSRVVAIDTDAACVGAIWQKAYARKLDILPLVVNFARPTPALGWRNQECDAFLKRAEGHFQCVLMLAVLHHLLVTERIPLGEILDVAADITSDALVIEFVGPQDDMFRTISRGRDALFSDLNEKAFEASAALRFTIVRSQRIGTRHRWLYLLRKRRE